MAAYRVLAKGAIGRTNMVVVIRMSMEELTRRDSGNPNGRNAKKLMYLLSDGRSSMSTGSPDVSDHDDQILAIRAAYLTRQAGIKIHTYALGPMASAELLL